MADQSLVNVLTGQKIVLRHDDLANRLGVPPEALTLRGREIQAGETAFQVLVGGRGLADEQLAIFRAWLAEHLGEPTTAKRAQ